ncbi:hypothetical protein P171DRAFT_276231 [Karstenula rhodostoma CBS 690.94]|uniref:DUF6594 domain-containing protein n=1 Tax=Karstenula rhodostoma CBS 690.94 TaxID=1392251 RepID=A0A9P4PNA0_9PLEO|nr:hypothetical protein P171DRAFT_276231 [Karstenula rhodostoma CBS 690.94]
MTDRRAAVDGAFGRTRHHSPGAETRSAVFQSSLGSDVSTASGSTRRRSSRARPVTDVASEHSSRSWLGANEDDIFKAKRGQTNPRRTANVPSVASSELSSSDTGKDASGLLPKLGRILEGKESKITRRRRDSTASSMDGHTSRRGNRFVDAAASKNRSARQKNNSMQRVEKNLANLQNPSLISVLSGLTHQSNASNESNSTITQQSYDKKLIAKRKPVKGRAQLSAKRSASTRESRNMASRSVFQYMDPTTEPVAFNEKEYQASHSSSASSPSPDLEHDDVSWTTKQPVVESPPTSPASTRRPNAEDSYDEDETDSEPHANSGPKLQPTVSEATSDSEGQEVEVEEESESSSDSTGEQASKASTAARSSRRESPTDRTALERIAPPRVPSTTSSRHSDRHTRRIRRQEQALAEHVLQNPQPHRDFHFTGAPSPHYPPAMPLYDPYSQSKSSPVNFAPTAHYAPPAAPPLPLTAPPVSQAVEYYSPPHAPPVPYSPPGYENQFAVAARSPMAASAVAQASAAQYSPTQALHYQARPPGPDLSRTTRVGYELLADKLSKGSENSQARPGEEAVVPMYRKFENLNHRVLLHLQDEIAELEEELRYLDECIAQCLPRDDAGRHQPASRRGDARYGGELHYRRTELLGRIYLKLGQYNSALTSFNTMVTTLDPAKAEDVQAYRSWMEKRTPIDHAETRFLEHKKDLLTVSEGGSASTVGGVTRRQSGAIWVPLVLVLPLMAFAIVPGLLGRLVILCLTGGAMVKLIASTKELMDMMTAREWAGCFSVLARVSALQGCCHALSKPHAEHERRPFAFNRPHSPHLYVRTALCESQADERVVIWDLWRFLRHWLTDSSERHCGVDIDRPGTRAAQTGTAATWPRHFFFFLPRDDLTWPLFFLCVFESVHLHCMLGGAIYGHMWAPSLVGRFFFLAMRALEVERCSDKELGERDDRRNGPANAIRCFLGHTGATPS